MTSPALGPTHWIRVPAGSLGTGPMGPVTMLEGASLEQEGGECVKSQPGPDTPDQGACWIIGPRAHGPSDNARGCVFGTKKKNESKPKTRKHFLKKQWTLFLKSEEEKATPNKKTKKNIDATNMCKSHMRDLSQEC